MVSMLSSWSSLNMRPRLMGVEPTHERFERFSVQVEPFHERFVKCVELQPSCAVPASAYQEHRMRLCTGDRSSPVGANVCRCCALMMDAGQKTDEWPAHQPVVHGLYGAQSESVGLSKAWKMSPTSLRLLLATAFRKTLLSS